MKSLLPTTGLALLLALSLTPVQGEEVTLEHQGLTLNANLETTGANWPQGPVVLMTHGTLAHGGMETLQGLQSAFKDRGISSLALTLSLGLDNRHGMYECNRAHTHQLTDAVAEIGAWLGWLHDQGATQIALLGHSRGGNQSARFAAEHPEAPISALILIAPDTWNETELERDYRQRYGKELAPRLEQARQLVSAGRGSVMMEHLDFLYCPDTSATAAALLSYYGPDPRLDTPRLIPDIKVPVLVIAGSEDKIAAELVPKVLPLADGQRVRLTVLDGADHFFRDLYADDIGDAVRALLDKTGS
ncbi:MAG: alpha/beta hydrolase [Chromatiaceae bacterium]|nr:alpha/beta hydrolase [Chromatiaceae bacterium]